MSIDFLTSHGFSQEQAEALQTWAVAREATQAARFDTLQTSVNRIEHAVGDLAAVMAQGFTDLGTGQARLEERMARVEQRLDGVEQRLGGVEQRLGGVEQRLDGHDRRFDRVDSQLGEVIERLRRIEQRFQAPPEAL